MGFITVPNTYASGNTVTASGHNENFSALVDGLTDGTKDLYVDTFSAESAISVVSNSSLNTLTVGGSATVASDASFTSSVSFSGGVVSKKFGLGPYVSVNVDFPASGTAFPSSYVALKKWQGSTISLVPDGLPLGTLVVLCLDPSSSGSIRFLGNSSDPVSGFARLYIPTGGTELTSVHDKFIFILREQWAGSGNVWVKIN